MIRVAKIRILINKISSYALLSQQEKHVADPYSDIGLAGSKKYRQSKVSRESCMMMPNIC